MDLGHMLLICVIKDMQNSTEADKTAFTDGANNPSDEAYDDMMVEEHPEQYHIENSAYHNNIGAKAMMDMPGEGPRWATFKRRVEDLDGSKVGTYYWNPLIDTRQYDLKYDDRTHER